MDSIAYITSRKKRYDLKDLESRRTKLDKEDLPKNVSAFFNDKGYIDKTVGDLINYYKKSETYNKEEVQELISTRILIKIVDELPQSNISTSTIYFLKRPKEDLPQSQYQSDVYDEYIYVDATWELIGNTYVDLTPYYTKEEVEIVIDNKILEERLIRENAEYVLQTNINNLEKKVNSEITQIKQKNLNQDNSISTLETNLQNEITRATNKENELSGRCDGYDSHISNKNNPHNVTKTQIGLNNVENLPIDNTPTLNSENYVKSGGVFNSLENKVDKIEGKGLSDENFTYEEKTKLSNLKNYDDTEIVNKVNKNTSAITILNSDSTVEGSVDNKIKSALLDVSGLQFNVVEELPTTGENGIIYFVLNNSVNEGKNYYDEYIWINNKFELLGRTVTEINLSNYHTKAEISALLSGKVDKGTDLYNYYYYSESTGIKYYWYKIIDSSSFNTTDKQIKLKFKLASDNNYPFKSEYILDVSLYMDTTTRNLSVSLKNIYADTNKDNGNIAIAIDEDYNVYAQFNCKWNSYVNITKELGNISFKTEKLGHSTFGTESSDFTPKQKIIRQGKFRVIKNLSTGVYTVKDVTDTYSCGISSKAIADANGNDIVNTYATKTELSTSEANAKDLANATGVLAVAKGGTGKTTAVNASNMFLNALSTDSSTPQDSDYYISQYAGGGTTYTTYHRRPVSALWDYIKGKISSVLGLTATAYEGKALTAGTADTATNDSKRQAITSYIRGLSISGKTITYTKGDGSTGTLTTQDTNTTYSAATQSTNGLMSASDKKKLDSIASMANAYVHPTTSGNKHIPSGGETLQILGYSADGTAKWTGRYDAVYTCSSDTSNNTKIVDIPNFTLFTGACIRVYFLYGNDSSIPKLNVNNTGAKTIVMKDMNDNYGGLSTEFGSLSSGAYRWNSVVLDMYYNGVYWVVIGNPIVYKKHIKSTVNTDYFAHTEIRIDGMKTLLMHDTKSTENGITVNFPIPFSSTHYYISTEAIDEGASNPSVYPLTVTEKRASYFKLNRSNDACENWNVYAKGY